MPEQLTQRMIDQSLLGFHAGGFHTRIDQFFVKYHIGSFHNKSPFNIRFYFYAHFIMICVYYKKGEKKLELKPVDPLH